MSLDDTFLTRGQLTQEGATPGWLKRHMKGRGKLSLSKIVTCAPEYFDISDYLDDYNGVVHYDDGGRTYYEDSVIHREGAAAEITSDGTAYWWYRGLRHRLDGPVRYPGGIYAFAHYLLGVRFATEESLQMAIPACLDTIEKGPKNRDELHRAFIQRIQALRLEGTRHYG